MRQEMMGFWDGSGISWTICKQSAPRCRQLTTSTPHLSMFYRLLALPDAQPTVSEHWRQIIEPAIIEHCRFYFFSFSFSSFYFLALCIKADSCQFLSACWNSISCHMMSLSVLNHTIADGPSVTSSVSTGFQAQCFDWPWRLLADWGQTGH